MTMHIHRHAWQQTIYVTRYMKMYHKSAHGFTRNRA